MRIILSPIRSDETLSLAVAGAMLTINGVTVDPLSDASDWVISAESIDGELTVTIRLPHGPDAPEATRYPAPITVADDGPVALPPHDGPAA